MPWNCSFKTRANNLSSSCKQQILWMWSTMQHLKILNRYFANNNGEVKKRGLKFAFLCLLGCILTVYPLPLPRLWQKIKYVPHYLSTCYKTPTTWALVARLYVLPGERATSQTTSLRLPTSPRPHRKLRCLLLLPLPTPLIIHPHQPFWGEKWVWNTPHLLHNVHIAHFDTPLMAQDVL